MPLDEGAALLRGRYELGTRRSAAGDAEAWTAYDEDGVQYRARTWAYDGDEPDPGPGPVQQTLWDAELAVVVGSHWRGRRVCTTRGRHSIKHVL